MKISKKITTTIGAVAIFSMFIVPAMANTSTQGDYQAGDTLLLARGGNGSGGGGNGSGDQSQDRDRDKDGSCLDNVTATTNVTALLIAGNGKGSGDQDRDHTQDKDASCQS